MKWLTAIISAIASGLLDKIMQRRDTRARWEAEQETEARRKQMESIKRSREQHQRMREDAAKRKRSKRPSDWNRNTGMILLACVLLLAGCKTPVYYEPRLPMIPAPERPSVPDEPTEWTARERIIVDYAETLEALIESYNRQAQQHNTEHGYE